MDRIERSDNVTRRKSNEQLVDLHRRRNKASKERGRHPSSPHVSRICRQAIFRSESGHLRSLAATICLVPASDEVAIGARNRCEDVFKNMYMGGRMESDPASPFGELSPAWGKSTR